MRASHYNTIAPQKIVASVKETQYQKVWTINTFWQKKKTKKKQWGLKSFLVIKKEDKHNVHKQTTCQGKMTINNREFEIVTNCESFGSIINKNWNCSKGVRKRLAVAMQRLNIIKNLRQQIYQSKQFESCIFSVATFRCESWRIAQSLKKKMVFFFYLTAPEKLYGFCRSNKRRKILTFYQILLSKRLST